MECRVVSLDKVMHQQKLLVACPPAFPSPCHSEPLFVSTAVEIGKKCVAKPGYLCDHHSNII